LAARRDVLSVAGLCNPALSRPPQQGRGRLAARRDVLSVAGLCNPALSRPPQQGRDRPRKPLEPVPEDKV